MAPKIDFSKLSAEDREALDQYFNDRFQEAQEFDARCREREQRNERFYGGVLQTLKLADGKQKFTKKKDESGKDISVPVLTEDGQPTFWESSYYCEVAQLGNTELIRVSLDLGKDLVEGHSYEFIGKQVEGKFLVKRVDKIRL